MSMAEAIPVVAETHQAISIASAQPQRPRISADAFKNLTARLKTTPKQAAAAAPHVVVPTFNESPAALAEPQPAPVIQPTTVEPVTEVPAKPFIAEAPVATSWHEAEAEFNQTAIAFEPSVEEAVETETLPVVEPASVVADPVFVEPVTVEEIDVTPLEVQPIVVEPIVAKSVFVDMSPIAPTPPPQRAFPELVNPLEVMAAQEAERIAREEAEAAAAAELAARTPPPPPRDPEEEARAIAEIAEARTIENIWRQILATPTSDDKTAYLREAREIMGDEAMVPPPEPEHDLSRIEPAQAIVEEPTVEVAEPISETEAMDVPAELSAIVQNNGQDTAELARSLLDMMAAGSSSGLPHERALAADTLLRLLPRLDLKPLVMLSQRLTMMDNPPHLLVAKLIRDPRVEVSGPLLEDCMQMTDQDILMVIDENKPDKLRMIARRRRLGRAISDALIKTADPSVLLTLVRNMEAEISHDGFNALIDTTDKNPDLLAPLSTRRDLGAPFAFQLFWHAPAQLRRFLLTRFLTDSETLTKILKITMATKDDDEPAEIEPMSQHVILEAFGRAMRGKLEPACDELAAALQINAKTVMRILNDAQGEPIVILLKAANYPRSALTGMLKKLQDAELPLISGERDVEELQSMFDTLSFNKARILLTYWDWATTKSGPYAPVH